MIRRPLPVARTRVVVPPPAPGLLARPRVQELLDPTGLSALAVVAGAGFGKTSALASWAAARTAPTAWYSVAEGDDEEFQFLACLAAALEVCGVEVEEAGDLLDREGARGRAALDLLLSAMVERPDLALVIDDAHRLRSEPVQEALGYLVRYLPAGVCVVLGSRRPPDLREWRGWLLRGRAREVGAADLALDDGEILALLRLRGGDPSAAAEIRERTGGWPLAVDVLARHGHSALPAGSADELLAEEIWADLGPDEQDLLLRGSVLEVLTPTAATRVGRAADAPTRLLALARQGLFLQALPEGAFRIHQLLRDFLRRRLDSEPEVRRQAWSDAADVALESGLLLEALEPLIQAGRTSEAADRLREAAPGLLAQARGPRLLDLGSRLRAAGWEPDARLLTLEAHALRQGGAFEAALERDRAALDRAATPEESSHALRGMARVYLDTLQPRAARGLLHRAFRVLPASAVEERAAVLDLLAENAVNEGRAGGARRYRRWARSLAARGPDRLDARILLRTGQLRAAREVLEARLAGRSETPDRPAEAHREDVLVLAYVAALQGEAEEAAVRARQGIEVARASGSRTTEAVGWMRLGHALQLQQSPEAAACYERAAEIVEATGVPRLQAEVLMGQALLHAHRGDVASSYACATEGLDLTRGAGDAWLSAWLRLVAGISACLGGHPGAPDLFRGAEEDLRRCRDAFGVAVVRAWLGQPPAAGYGFVLERPTLFGPRTFEARPAPEPEDEESAEPLLRVQLLGGFRLWRRGVEVEPRAWKRLKARELFLILLTRRGVLQQKEHLMELLWPDASLQAANRDFRVALHALSEVLDPDRPRNEPARWLERRDAAYCFRPSAEVSLDVDDFERLARRAREVSPEESDVLLRRALALYRGDFLEDHPYADWAAPERERLRGLYLEMAETVARRALERGDEETASETAHAMLARDRCWEEAWRILMRLHLRQGRAFMAIRAYEQCAQALEEELGVSPADATEELYAEASR